MNFLLNHLQSRSRGERILAVIGIMGVIAGFDYLTGAEYSFFIFYLFPVGLTVWILDLYLAQLLIVLSVLLSGYIDFNLGCPFDRLLIYRWNGWTTIFMFFVATYLLSKMKGIVSNLEELIVKRTHALELASLEKMRLQEEILEIGDHEQQRIACDLHDIVCQHLTGVSLKAKALEAELKDLHLPQATFASKISVLVVEAIDLTRNCAEGLFPLEIFSENLTDMIHKIVDDTNQAHAIFCRAEADDFVRIKSKMELVELYRITLEAVRNAVKYSKANEVVIRLHQDGEWGRLEIEDDGIGFVEGSKSAGMGIRVMKHRAQKIGAVLQVLPGTPSGTMVTCVWKLDV